MQDNCWTFYSVLFDVNCCMTNCHSTECLAPCGAVFIAAILQCALHLLLQPCNFCCSRLSCMLVLYGVVPILADTAYCMHYVRGLVLRSTLTLFCRSVDVVFTLMFVLSIMVLIYFLIVCHTMFCSIRHTRVAMSAICILDCCICSLFGFPNFVGVELIEEDIVKDIILNFSVLIVNSLPSIVPGCVSLRSSLQGNQNV